MVDPWSPSELAKTAADLAMQTKRPRKMRSESNVPPVIGTILFTIFFGTAIAGIIRGYQWVVQ